MNENELRARIRNQFNKDRTKFTRAAFLGSLTNYKGNQNTGTLDLIINVGPGEKDEALKVTDAPGELLLIEITRISQKKLKGKLHAVDDAKTDSEATPD